MVMSFFRKDEPGIEQIAAKTIAMLAEARHSFDLASSAVLSGADPVVVGKDIRATDDRINAAEQQLRGELVVHVSVQGTDDIGTVLSYTLLIKKIERIGDQAKNILDLADEGISFVGAPDIDELLDYRREISAMFTRVGELLSAPDDEQIAELVARTDTIRHEHESKVREFLHSDQPGSHAVPRAILYRYWKRIVANLAGVITTATEPLQNQDYQDDGQTDIDDD